MARYVEQVTRDRNRKVYRLAFPTDLDPERVTGWLRSISGTLHTTPLRRMFKGVPSISVEVWATSQGIEHRLKIPWQYEQYLRPKLESLVPGIRLVAEDEFPTRVWVQAVEAGLKASHRPLHIPLASDLSTSILTSFGSLAEGETLMMQWVISPATPEHKPIYGESSSKENSVWSLITGGVATRDEINERRDKLGEPNMLAVLRVGAVANTPTRAQHMIRGIISTLDSSRGPANHFYKRLVGKPELQARIQHAASPHVFPVQLSAPELSAVIGWPLGTPTVAGLPSAVSRRLPTPEAVPREGRVIGASNFSGRERNVAMSYLEARKHVHVLGGTGAGKTTLLANMMRQDMKAGYGIVLIESKGDLFRLALDYVPPERIDDVIVFDVNDVRFPIGFNVLQQGDAATVVDELNMVFNEMFRDSPSLWMQEVMYHGLHTLASDPKATFVDLAALVSPTADELGWRDNLIRSVRDPQLRNFWQRFDNQPRARQDQIAQPVLSRVWPMSRSKLMNIVGQSKSTFQMSDVVRDNKILLVNLSNIERGASSLMGTLVLNALWQAVKQQHTEKGVFLYLDEFHHYMNLPVDIEQMLVEARSMGLGMVLAHQYLDQLTAKNMEQAIMSNARTKVSFQLGSDDARSMAGNFGKSISDEDLQHLAKYEAVSRIATDEGVSAPLTLNTLPPAPGYGKSNQVLYASRGRYGTPVNQVQDELLARRSAVKNPRRAKPKPTIEGWGGI